MEYKHILVAVDLTESSDVVIRKAVSIAKMSQAEVSLVFVDLEFPLNNRDLNFTEYEFTTIEPDTKISDMHRQKLQELADGTDYPLANSLYLTGDLTVKLQQEVEELGADLLICGHHHGFWSGLVSSTRKIVSTATVDLFIVQV